MRLLYVASVALLGLGFAKNQEDSASASLNQFALNFLLETSKLAPEDLNIAISPLTVWTAMSIVNEGARQNTAAEIEKVLGIPSNNNATLRQNFRKHQQDIMNDILQKSEGVTLELLNSLFFKQEFTLNSSYSNLVKKIYNVDVHSLDFNNASATANYINEILSNATNGRLQDFVDTGSVEKSIMFMTSALFFKGLWDKKFDKEDTLEKPFHNEDGEIIGKVQMMLNHGTFPYGSVLNGDAEAVEMPYVGNRMSMIAFLPRKNVRLSTVLEGLSQTSILNILDSLKQYKEQFPDDEVVIKLPRFKVSSDWILNHVLHQMGIHDAFNQAYANLNGIAPENLFVSRVIHKAEIEVDEDGTVGSSVTVVEVTNRITPGTFNADKPFAFVIVDKLTNSIIFAGKVTQPNFY